MKTYPVLRRLSHDNVDYDAGASVELSAEQAATLIPIGVVAETQDTPMPDDDSSKAGAGADDLSAPAEAGGGAVIQDTHGESANGSGGDDAGAQAPASEPDSPAASGDNGEGDASPTAGKAVEAGTAVLAEVDVAVAKPRRKRGGK